MVSMIQRGKKMTTAGRTFKGLVCCLFILALSACGGATANVTPGSVEVMLDTPIDEIAGGVRLAPPENHWDGYGRAVDVYGDVLVVGESEWNHSGSGSVYVYRLLDGAWQQEAQLKASDSDKGQFAQGFGTSVTLGDGILAVGAPGTDDSQAGENIGAVYVFEFDGRSWVERAKLMPDRTNQENVQNELGWESYGGLGHRSFGDLVALHADTLAVGGNSDTDIVYVFQHSEDRWQEQARIPIPGSSGRELYMTSLALFGDSLALSVLYVPPQPEPLLLLSGTVTVYLYERIGKIWKEGFRFIPEDGEKDFLYYPGENVGASVALGGIAGKANLFAVGLSGFPDWTGELDPSLLGSNPDRSKIPVSSHKTGAVYIFEPAEDGGWNQQVTLKPAGWENPPGPGSFPENPSPTDVAAFVFPGDVFSENPEISFFGETVDLDGNQLAVTSGFANATYVFERSDQDWVYRFRITPSQVDDGLWEDFDQIVTLSDSILLLGTPGEHGNSAYVFRLCGTSIPDCK
jgi:hypothetical protein